MASHPVLRNTVAINLRLPGMSTTITKKIIQGEVLGKWFEFSGTSNTLTTLLISLNKRKLRLPGMSKTTSCSLIPRLNFGSEEFKRF